MLSAMILAMATTGHLIFSAEIQGTRLDLSWLMVLPVYWLVLAAATHLLLTWLGRLATWLTAKESRFWGMRLPHEVITRAMQFHAANYLPVAVAALIVTWGYQLLLFLNIATLDSAVAYLACLCVVVVGSAFWMFESFVVAMRRIRFANE